MTDITSPQIGLLVSQQRGSSYPALRDVAARAEELGAELVFTTDHFLPWSGPPHGAYFECWMILAAWAEQTSTVRLGSLVTGVGFRNPHLLADMARTVDHISNGRLVLGVGAGWSERDYSEYGFDFGTAKDRSDLLKHNLSLITARLATLHPPPSGPLPLLIGGSGHRRTLPLVAEHADIWHSFGSISEFQRNTSVLTQLCLQRGRNPHDIIPATSWSGPLLTEQLCHAGARIIVCDTAAPDYDLTSLREALEWKSRLVLPSPPPRNKESTPLCP